MLSLTCLELTVITLLGLLYVSLFPVKNVATVAGNSLEINLFDADVQMDALEHERLSGVLLPFEIGLCRYGHIPTWNPYIGTGEPTLNNPFNYLFNPFASLPVLLFGGVQGTKLAIVLALLLAGYNMWALARVVGIGSVGRLAAGSLYMMSGGIAGKFHAGHFQLGLSLAWMPLVFAGLWWTLHSTDRRAPVLTGATFALLFFAGNIYYTLHTLICMGVIVAFHLFERNQDGLRFAGGKLRRVAIAGAFSLGLSALQFVPLWAVRDYIGGHPGDPQLASRYDLTQALANFTFPWPSWTMFETANYKMLVGVDYAYIGPALLLLLPGGIGLLLTRSKLGHRTRGPIVWIALVLALLMIVWGAGQTAVLQYLYANIPRLAEFRFVGRAHAIAALWLLVLVGLSVDILWKAARHDSINDRGRIVRAMLVGWLVWLLFFNYSAQPDSGRAAMVFYNYRFKEALDTYRFTNFNDAAQGLFGLVFIAIVGDTLLWVLSALRHPAHLWQKRSTYGSRLLTVVLLAALLFALADIMQVNSGLFEFNRRVADFSELYSYVRENDQTTPFPAINEPYSPFAFSAYEAEIRNWGLGEGWTPATPPSIIPFEEGELSVVPRWALVWNAMGGLEVAQRFVETYGYQARACTSTELAGYLAERCNLEAPGTAILYELPDALPYAFVVEAERLTTQPETVNSTTIQPAEILSNQQDTVTIRAAQPVDEDSKYYLVVQETHFPGWSAFVDGEPVETTSVGRFIGVPMQAGEHSYMLRYEPPGLATGVVVFLATLIGIVLYLRNGSSQERV